MGHFATPKTQGHLNLIAFAQKLQHRAHFDVIVMLVCTGAELDFFDFNDVLLFAGLSLTLLLLILEFAEVHDLADRWLRVRRDFDQIQSGLLGHGHRAGGRNNAHVFAIRTNQADFGAADAVIHTGARIALRRGVVGSAGYGLHPSFIDIGAGDPPTQVKIDLWAGLFNTFRQKHDRFYAAMQRSLFNSCHFWHNHANRHRRRALGDFTMNKSVILGVALIAVAGLGYYQLSYVPAQQAAQEATMKAAEEAKAAEAAAVLAAEEAAAKAAEEAKAAEDAAAKAAEAAAMKAAEELNAAEEAAKKAAEEAALIAEEKAAEIEAEAKAAADAAAAAAVQAEADAKAAADAAANAADEATAKAAEEAQAAAEAAEKAAADAAAAVADTANSAADAMDPTRLLDAATFDAAKVAEMIDGSSLDATTKATLKSAVTAASSNPLVLQGVLDQVKAAMGL